MAKPVAALLASCACRAGGLVLLLLLLLQHQQQQQRGSAVVLGIWGWPWTGSSTSGSAAASPFSPLTTYTPLRPLRPRSSRRPFLLAQIRSLAPAKKKSAGGGPGGAAAGSSVDVESRLAALVSRLAETWTNTWRHAILAAADMPLESRQAAVQEVERRLQQRASHHLAEAGLQANPAAQQAVSSLLELFSDAIVVLAALPHAKHAASLKRRQTPQPTHCLFEDFYASPLRPEPERLQAPQRQQQGDPLLPLPLPALKALVDGGPAAAGDTDTRQRTYAKQQQQQQQQALHSQQWGQPLKLQTKRKSLQQAPPSPLSWQRQHRLQALPTLQPVVSSPDTPQQQQRITGVQGGRSEKQPTHHSSAAGSAKQKQPLQQQ